MFKPSATCVGVLSLLTASFACAETVTVRSGNGNGTKDDFVSVLIGPYSSDFSKPLPATDFSSAQTGPPAFIITPNANWLTALAEDPAAHWIGTNAAAGVNQGNTGLYGESFQFHNSFTSATLSLHYAVDDAMGAVYLNGTPVCANSIENDLANFTRDHTFTCNDVGPALHLGTNWLYIDASNGGAAAGLIYSATITTTEGAILPHLAAGDVWTTGFFVVNTGAQAAQFTIQFFDNNGNSLALPFPGGPMSTVMDSVPGQGMNYYESSAPGNPLLVGWGLFTAGSSVAVQAVFRKNTGNGQFDEAAVPSSSATLEFVVPFDASTLPGTSVPLATAIAIANLDPGNSANVTCIARNQQGVTILNAVTVPLLNPLGHWSDYNFPALAGARGTIDCTANTAISAVAFRFVGSAASTTFSSLPVLNINSTAATQPILPTPNPAPSITTLSPSSVTAGTSSLTLIVNGSGFIASTTAVFNGAAHAATFVNSGQLTIALSAADLATAGSFPVVVANPSPGGGVSNNVTLTVLAPPPPRTLTGVWSGAWGSIPVPSAYGLLSATITQAGTALSGSVTLGSSYCGGGPLSGTVTGNNISGVIAGLITISATVDSSLNHITGAYLVSSGPCTGDYGVITLTRQ